jgi:hydroxypyruvate reductase 1
LQDWSEELFSELAAAGGSVYSNYAVGYNNVDAKAATKHGIAVGNTPGMHCSQVMGASSCR